MEVEYYRLWQSQIWDTDFIEIPDNTPEERMDEEIRKAAAVLRWEKGECPVIVGLYHYSDEEEGMNLLLINPNRQEHRLFAVPLNQREFVRQFHNKWLRVADRTVNDLFGPVWGNVVEVLAGAGFVETEQVTEGELVVFWYD